MSEIEQVDQLRTAGKTVAKACKQVGISVPTYYAQRKVNNGEQNAPVTQPEVDGRYFAILDALRNLHMGDVASARKALIDALLM